MGHLRRAARPPVVAAIAGAGLSAESGVPTFRGAGGLWRRYRATDLATPAAFARDPQLVWEWYAWRRELVAACRPNRAHRALAALERAAGEFLLVTQNVDGLETQAGVRRVEAVHGDLWSLRCTQEGRIWVDRTVPLRELPPRCPACGALARPNVLWFGESYDAAQLQRAAAFVRRAHLVLVVGTSGAIALPHGLVAEAKSAGARVVEFNVEASDLTALADEFVAGPAAATLPAYVRAAFGRPHRPAPGSTPPGTDSPRTPPEHP